MPKIVLKNDLLAPDLSAAATTVFSKADGLYLVLADGTVVGPLGMGIGGTAAGGSLTGTYPNPGIAFGAIDVNQLADGSVTGIKIANSAITLSKLDASLIDPIAGLGGVRTLGTGAQQAAAGNDSRFTDSRAPNGPATGDLAGTYPAPTIDSLQGYPLDLTVAPTPGYVLTWNGTNWIAGIGTDGTTLQSAYVLGPTVSVVAAPIAFSNVTNAVDVLTLSRTFAGGGQALSVSMGALTTEPAIEIAQTGVGVSSHGIVLVLGAAGPAAGNGLSIEFQDVTSSGIGLAIDNQGTGALLSLGDPTGVMTVRSDSIIGARAAMVIRPSHIPFLSVLPGLSLTLTGSNALGLNQPGGDLVLDGGAGSSGGANGTISIGVTTADNINSGHGAVTWAHTGAFDLNTGSGGTGFIFRIGASNRLILETGNFAGAPVMTLTPDATALSYTGQITYWSDSGVIPAVDVLTAKASPEGLVFAGPGSICHVRYSSANANDGLWVKNTGTGTTGWARVGTSSAAVVTSGFTTTGLADGDLGYISASQTVTKAIATAFSTSLVIGANEGTVGSMTTSGTIENQNVESGITVTAGNRLYLSATEAGKVTNVAPVTAGQVVAPVGIARTTGAGAGSDVSMLLMIGTPVLL